VGQLRLGLAADQSAGELIARESWSAGLCFSLGGGGREVPRSVAVERLRVRAGWAKSRCMGPGSACLCRYKRSMPGGTRHD